MIILSNFEYLVSAVKLFIMYKKAKVWKRSYEGSELQRYIVLYCTVSEIGWQPQLHNHDYTWQGEASAPVTVSDVQRIHTAAVQQNSTECGGSIVTTTNHYRPAPAHELKLGTVDRNISSTD